MSHRRGFRIFWSGKDQDLLEMVVKGMMSRISDLKRTYGFVNLSVEEQSRHQWSVAIAKEILDTFPLRLQDAGISVIRKKASSIFAFVRRHRDRSFEDIMNLLIPEWKGRTRIPGEYELHKCWCGQLYYAKVAQMCSDCRARKRRAIHE